MGDVTVRDDVPAVPAHIAQLFGQTELNDDLSQGVGGGYPHLSYRGKNWHVVRGENRDLVVNADGDPKSTIELVILRANPAISKIYYKGGYVEGSNEKPTCYSNDGMIPAMDAAERQAQKCGVCPHNQWGSRISESGAKGKNCSDSRRLAVAPFDDLENAMLLRVPAASLKDLAQYADMLKRRRTPYQAVVTKVSFDPEAAYPKFIFKAARWLSADEATTVADVMGRDVVESIISATRIEQEPAEQLDELGPPPAHAQQLPEPAPKASKLHVSAKEVEAVFEPEPEPAPVVVAEAPKPKATKAETLVASAEQSLEEALASLDFD